MPSVTDSILAIRRLTTDRGETIREEMIELFGTTLLPAGLAAAKTALAG
jgi:hypothetical protein